MVWRPSPILSFTQAGLYRLTAIDSETRGVKSNQFRVMADAASARLVLLQQPSTGVVNSALRPAIILQVEDQFANRLSANASVVSIGMMAGPAGGIVKGTTRMMSNAGLAAFGNLKLTAPGDYTLQAIDPSLPVTTPVSLPVTINANPSSRRPAVRPK